MTANDFTRAPRTTLNGAINNSVTTINITSATGWQTPGDNYYAKVWAASGDQFLNFLDGETVTVTALAGAALTVTRGEDDTTAASWSDGDHIMVVGPAEILQEHNDHANTTTGTPHGTAYETGTTHDARSHAGIEAGTATKWTTGRTITLTGDVTGVSGALDGSGNLSFATTHAADSVDSTMMSLDWVDWPSPTITQSVGVTFTKTYGKYLDLGGLIIARCILTCTSAGTAANAVILGGFPVAAASSNSIGGSFDITDAATNNYTGTVRGSGGNAAFQVNADANQFGVGPAVTLAATDIIRATLIYEA